MRSQSHCCKFTVRASQFHGVVQGLPDDGAGHATVPIGGAIVAGDDAAQAQYPWQPNKQRRSEAFDFDKEAFEYEGFDEVPNWQTKTWASVEKIKVFAAVISAAANREQRDAIRATWGADERYGLTRAGFCIILLSCALSHGGNRLILAMLPCFVLKVCANPAGCTECYLFQRSHTASRSSIDCALKQSSMGTWYVLLRKLQVKATV